MHVESGNEIEINRDTGLCDRMPYIYMTKIQARFAMLHTVRNNFEGFTKNVFERDTLATEVQAMLEHPIHSSFKEMSRHGTLRDFRVTIQDVFNALEIFGPDLTGAHGKKSGT